MNIQNRFLTLLLAFYCGVSVGASSHRASSLGASGIVGHLTAVTAHYPVVLAGGAAAAGAWVVARVGEDLCRKIRKNPWWSSTVAALAGAALYYNRDVVQTYVYRSLAIHRAGTTAFQHLEDGRSQKQLAAYYRQVASLPAHEIVSVVGDTLPRQTGALVDATSQLTERNAKAFSASAVLTRDQLYKVGENAVVALNQLAAQVARTAIAATAGSTPVTAGGVSALRPIRSSGCRLPGAHPAASDSSVSGGKSGTLYACPVLGSASGGSAVYSAAAAAPAAAGTPVAPACGRGSAASVVYGQSLRDYYLHNACVGDLVRMSGVVPGDH